MPWFLNLMEELGIECRVGHPAQIRAAEPRKQKHDRRDAELILKLWPKTVSRRSGCPARNCSTSALCYCTVISGCACARVYKTRCRPWPWRTVYDEVLVCGATTDRKRSRSYR